MSFLHENTTARRIVYEELFRVAVVKKIFDLGVLRQRRHLCRPELEGKHAPVVKAKVGILQVVSPQDYLL